MADPRQQDVSGASRQASRRAADAAAETGEHAAKAGADLFRSTASAVEEAWRSSLGVASHFAEQSSSQMARVLGVSGDKMEDAAEQSSRNIDAILQSSRTFAETFKNVSRECSNFYRERLDRNLEKMDAIMRSRTPQELVAAQSDLMRDNLEAFLQTSRRIAEASMHVADEAGRRATRAAHSERQAA